MCIWLSLSVNSIPLRKKSRDHDHVYVRLAVPSTRSCGKPAFHSMALRHGGCQWNFLAVGFIALSTTNNLYRSRSWGPKDNKIQIGMRHWYSAPYSWLGGTCLVALLLRAMMIYFFCNFYHSRQLRCFIGGSGFMAGCKNMQRRWRKYVWAKSSCLQDRNLSSDTNLEFSFFTLLINNRRRILWWWWKSWRIWM